MNVKNIRKAIAVMQRVIDRKCQFSMANWQTLKAPLLKSRRCACSDCAFTSYMNMWVLKKRKNGWARNTPIRA